MDEERNLTLGSGALRERAEKTRSKIASLTAAAFSSACKSESAALHPEKRTIGPIVWPSVRG